MARKPGTSNLYWIKAKVHETKGEEKRPLSGSALVSGQDSVKKFCVVCNQENHKSHQCKIVSKPEVRRNIIMSKKLCYVCLKSGHIAQNCRSNIKCFKCKGCHHVCICTFKHPDVDISASSGSQTDTKREIQNTSQNVASVKQPLKLMQVDSVLLQTAQARVFSFDGKNEKKSENPF